MSVSLHKQAMLTFLLTYLHNNLFNHAGHTQLICKNTMSQFSDALNPLQTSPVSNVQNEKKMHSFDPPA
jgi:hypothetical protein